MSSLVAFVGAGPRDPELITLKGVDRIQRADVILFDDLSAGLAEAVGTPAQFLRRSTISILAAHLATGPGYAPALIQYGPLAEAEAEVPDV